MRLKPSMDEKTKKKEYLIVTPEETEKIVARLIEEDNAPPPKRLPEHEGLTFNQKIRDMLEEIERKKFLSS